MSETKELEEAFKVGMRHLAAAVNVICAAENGDRAGLTATAACSLCVEPPTLLACVNRGTSALPMILRSRHFSVNVLAKEQEAIAMAFASPDKEARFKLGSWVEGQTGAPLLEGSLVNFDCELAEVFEYGTHDILLGRVVEVRTDPGHAPLVYMESKFTTLVPVEEKA